MRLGKTLKGKNCAELSVQEFASIYNEKGVSRQYILKLIEKKRLPEGVISYKLGRAYVIQSTRKEDISLLTKK